MRFKLFIYDTADEDNREQAEERFGEDEWVVPLPAGSKDELTAGLERLIKQQQTFDRVLIQTHGVPGQVDFGNDRLGWVYFSSVLPWMKATSLFPYYTRIYFDGCDVGADNEGTRFIKEVGSGLLRMAGGEVFAWTSPGYAYSGWWVPGFVKGHTLHWNGDIKRATFGPGGRLIYAPAS
jgi:hypothetical protein